MAVRKETEQAGLTVNHPHTTGRIYGGVGCTIAVLLAVLLTLFAPLGSAPVWAQDPTDGVTQPSATPVALHIEEITPVITDTSGFAVRATIENHGAAAVEHARLAVRTNAQYNFISRSDVQAWAEGTAMIPTPDELLMIDVGTVETDGARTVHGELHADAAQLQALTAWGPRPLALELIGEDGDPLPGTTPLQTFLTRSQAGLHGERTPAINLTVAMPLTSHSWQANTAVTDRLLSSGSSGVRPSDAVTLGADDVRALKAKDELAARFGHLQIVGDPLVLRAIGTPHVQAISQPGMFDVTTYARMGDAGAYTRAGINDQAWRAETGVNLLRSALGDERAQARAIAWQGEGSWTMQALDTARAQGYETVVATRDFALQDDATATTETYHVPTDHGEVTVLTAQSTLSTLAQQRPTSAQASAEQTDAGRLQRLIAQSAFYQMEQPYESRSLLVCLGESANSAFVTSLMTALGSASWVHLASLDELAAAEPAIGPSLMPDLINQVVGQQMPAVSSALEALNALARSRDDIERFNTSILVTGQPAQAPDGSAPSASPQESGEAGAKASPSAAPSASAQPDARLSADAWAQYLLQAHDAFALPALSPHASARAAMVTGARRFTDTLLGRITLVPSGSLNVVSETASMPVTVSNKLPYPISVRVSSLTDSMEIVTSRLSDVDVGPNSEAQTSFVVRVSTSGTTVAREQLLDRHDKPFGAVQQTTITSSLQLSDKSGIAIIAIAVVLGLLGLWRQFHRKKDPDE